MTQTLSERLQEVRARRFVGRARETGQFRALLDSSSPRAVQYVHGLGGTGKTTWIAHCAPQAQAAGCRVYRLDARSIPAEPPQIMAALGLAPGSPVPPPVDDGQPSVLFIDTFEFWQSLEGWVRDDLLPQLPANLRIVICGRRPPSPEWKLDPGWHELMSVSQIGNFDESEAKSYLGARMIPQAREGEAIRYSHGNPLALAMVADLLEREPDAPLDHRVDRETTRQLVERLTREGVKPEQREAMQVAAVALEVNEQLLSGVMRTRQGAELAEWMAGLSFMLPGNNGLFPHDLVREILMAELMSRHPARYNELARRVFDYEIGQMMRHAASDWRLAAAQVFNAVFALRASPGLDGFLVVNGGGEMYVDLPQPLDLPVIEAGIARHQGQESLALFRHWMGLQPEGLVVLRSPSREVLGFLMNLDLARATHEQRAVDPMMQDLWNLAAERGPLPEDHAFVCSRFWMSLAEHQASSPVATTLSSLALGHTIMHPRLAVMCMVHSCDAEYWARFARRVHIEMPEPLRWQTEGRAFRTYMADWRVESRLEWMLHFSRRVTEDVPQAIMAPAQPGLIAPMVEQLPVLPQLSAELFADAVHDALEHYHETHELQTNPLLSSRMIAQRAGPDAKPSLRLTALRDLITETNEKLGAVSKTAKCSKILHRTYIEPARSQQFAAEALGMGYSTYRRQLAAARELFTAELWQLEQ